MTSADRPAWRTPAAEELPRVYAMLVAAYRAADPAFPDDPSIFARFTECDPHFRAEHWLVGELAGEPVTALRIFERELLGEGGARLRLAGIGNVGTHPAHAGEGLGSALLERAAGFLRGRCDLSLLYATRTGFYGRAGWRPLRTPWRRLLLSAPLSRLGIAEACSIEPAAAGWEVVASLHEAGYANQPGALVRSRAYWERWIGGFALAGTRARLLVAERRGRPVAYLAGRELADGVLEVLEGAAVPGEGEALPELARSLAPGAQGLSWPEVPALRALERISGEAETVTRDAGLVRFFGAPSEFAYLLSHLDRF